MLYTGFSTIGLVFVPLIAQVADNSTAVLTAWGVVVAIATLVLVGIQITIALRQGAIMNRKEDLSFTGVDEATDTYTFHAVLAQSFGEEAQLTLPIPLSIRNRGKSIQGVTLIVWADEEHDEKKEFWIYLGDEWLRGASEFVEDEVTGENVDRAIHTRQYPSLLLPGDGRTVELNPPLEVTIPKRSHTYILHVQMLSESGTFPKSGPQRVQFVYCLNPKAPH